MTERYYDFKKATILAATEDYPRHSEASILELNDGSLLTLLLLPEYPPLYPKQNTLEGSAEEQYLPQALKGCPEVPTQKYLPAQKENPLSTTL